jgi:hypothetical protein
MVTGVSWKEDDEVLYDDSTVLVFNHESDSSLAAITTKDDPHCQADSADKVEGFQSLHLPNLDSDAKAKMDYDDVQLYEMKQDELRVAKDHLLNSVKL